MQSRVDTVIYLRNNRSILQVLNGWNRTKFEVYISRAVECVSGTRQSEEQLF